MHLAHRLVALIVGLNLLAPLHIICFASPISSPFLVVRDIESPPIQAPPQSASYASITVSHGFGTDVNHLDKRRSKEPDFRAFEEPNSGTDGKWLNRVKPKKSKDTKWLIEANEKIGNSAQVRIMTQSKRELGSGSYGTVFEGTWERYSPHEDPVPVAIKISDEWTGYFGARVLARVKSPYVVGIYQYALTEKGQSIAAYEKLGKSAREVWRMSTLTKGGGFYKAVMLGALAGVEKDIFHMDIKPENILRSGDTWKLIDWDIFIDLGDPDQNKIFDYAAGTFFYMAPEMALLDLAQFHEALEANPEGVIEKFLLALDQCSNGWKPGQAQVFTIAYMFLDIQNQAYDQHFTREMKALKEFMKTNDEGNGEFNIDNKIWFALHMAHLKGEATPEKILKILPRSYQKRGKSSDWGIWFSKTLCNPDERYTLQEAWKKFPIQVPR